MKIICVNGFPRSGKDEFCKTVETNCSGVYSFSTIDEVKRLATQLGWDGKKDEKGRKFLATLKDCLSEYNDLPTQHTLQQMQEVLDSYRQSGLSTHDIVFLIQMREAKDINRWKDDYGARALLIKRPGFDGDWGNHADDEVLHASYNYQLLNSSDLDEWARKSIGFINSIKEEKWESDIWNM